MTNETCPISDRVAAIGAALYPSLFTWVYFVMIANEPQWVQQSTYVIGKCFQFGFPLVWIAMISRRRERVGWPAITGVWEGVGFGASVLVAMLAGYFLVLRNVAEMQTAAQG